MHPKEADGMANSVDPDQTAPFRSSLIWVCTVCLDLSVPIFRILMVILVKIFCYDANIQVRLFKLNSVYYHMTVFESDWHYDTSELGLH